MTVKIPKVRAKTGEAVTFRSALVPAYGANVKSGVQATESSGDLIVVC